MSNTETKYPQYLEVDRGRRVGLRFRVRAYRELREFKESGKVRSLEGDCILFGFF